MRERERSFDRFLQKEFVPFSVVLRICLHSVYNFKIINEQISNVDRGHFFACVNGKSSRSQKYIILHYTQICISKWVSVILAFVNYFFNFHKAGMKMYRTRRILLSRKSFFLNVKVCNIHTSYKMHLPPF